MFITRFIFKYTFASALTNLVAIVITISTHIHTHTHTHTPTHTHKSGSGSVGSAGYRAS